MLLNEFTRNYKAKLTASDIAKSLNLNQKTVSNHLHKLTNQRYLKTERQGKNLLFQLNFFNKDLTTNFLINLEIKKSLQLLKKHTFIQSLLQDIKAQNLLIFGSYAKGLEHKKSDLDVFIVGNYNKKEFRNLETVYGIEVNVHSIADFNNVFHKTLVDEIVKDHVILRGFDIFVRNFLKGHYLI